MKKKWMDGFIRGALAGAGFGAGLAVVAALAVTVGTIKTWTSGETLTASDINTTISSLKTAIESIPDWTKSGSDAVYTAGKVGIGTTTPPSPLSVAGSAGIGRSILFDNSEMKFRGDDFAHFSIFGVWSGHSYFSIANTSGSSSTGAGVGIENLVIATNGNVGIGTTAPGDKFHVVGGTNTGIRLESSGTLRHYKLYNQSSQGDFRIMDTLDGMDKFVISNVGYVGVGTTPSYPLHMASGAYVTTGGVWTNASSREFKRDLRDLSAKDALAAVTALRPKTFRYKADPSERHVGFIAEDVPELLATKARKGLSAMDIVAVLTKVVQEQQKEIDALRREIGHEPSR